MADGYGFGGEGDWKTAALLRVMKVMAHGLPGGTSFMEDYTYHLGPGRPKVLGAHMLEICPSIAAGSPSCEIHPLGIGGRDDPGAAGLHRAAGPGGGGASSTWATASGWSSNEVDMVAPPRGLPRLPVARAVWKPRPDLKTAAEAWIDRRRPAPHACFTTALGIEAIERLRRDGRHRAGRDRRGHHASRSSRNELRWNQAYYHLARGL